MDLKGRAVLRGILGLSAVGGLAVCLGWVLGFVNSPPYLPQMSIAVFFGLNILTSLVIGLGAGLIISRYLGVGPLWSLLTVLGIGVGMAVGTDFASDLKIGLVLSVIVGWGLQSFN